MWRQGADLLPNVLSGLWNSPSRKQRARHGLQEELCARAGMTLGGWKPKDIRRPLVKEDSFIGALLGFNVYATSLRLATWEFILKSCIFSF